LCKAGRSQAAVEVSRAQAIAEQNSGVISM